MVAAIRLCYCFVVDVAWYLKEQFGIKAAMELARIQMAQRKKKMSVDDAVEQGAEAFRHHKSYQDNPFDFASQRELFDAWRDGFINEKQWWGNDE